MAQPKTVLIVDDDADFIACTRTMLASAGYHTVEAQSGKEALERCAERKPDLILLDVMMNTDEEGFQTSYKLRGNPEYADIPIIMITAVSQKTGMDFAPDADSDFIQADVFLEKPVRPEVLLAKVGEMIA